MRNFVCVKQAYLCKGGPGNRGLRGRIVILFYIVLFSRSKRGTDPYKKMCRLGDDCVERSLDIYYRGLAVNN